MKKISLIMLAVLLCVSFVRVGLADDYNPQQDNFNIKMATAKTMEFEGIVLDHDPACHCIVVKTAEGNLTLQDDYARFDQEYNEIRGLKIGAKVRGMYKTVGYINYATSIAYVK
jgi:hypothetical protein